MVTEVSKRIQTLLAQEMGPMGVFILKKQCKDRGLDPDELKVTDLPDLSQILYKAMVVFTGEEKGKKIQDAIRKIGVEASNS